MLQILGPFICCLVDELESEVSEQPSNWSVAGQDKSVELVQERTEKDALMLQSIRNSSSPSAGESNLETSNCYVDGQTANKEPFLNLESSFDPSWEYRTWNPAYKKLKNNLTQIKNFVEGIHVQSPEKLHLSDVIDRKVTPNELHDCINAAICLNDALISNDMDTGVAIGLLIRFLEDIHDFNDVFLKGINDSKF